jgi:hypothetical protein
VFLSVIGTVRVNPNKCGDSVGCHDATFDVEVTTEKLTKATRATVEDRLSPVPKPDLVPRPDFTVSIKGVRMVYYSVKGTSATKLRTKWAEISSRAKYCGRVEYEWHTGNTRTLSCIKSSSDPDITYVADTFTGSCTITGVDPNWRMSMPIAKWAGPSIVPRGLVTWWKQTQRYVRDHEAGHVAIYRDWLPKLRSRLKGADCSDATAIMKKWSNQVSAAQEAYDKREYARTDWPQYPSDAP